jgi:hypothetical protein
LTSDLENQLSQLDELLSLLDANALRGAQEALENQIVELTERLEVTRQALAQAQSQRRRLARARLLLEDTGHEPGVSNGNPAFNHTAEAQSGEPSSPPQTPVTAPFVAERRSGSERRATGERRQVTERRKGQQLPPAS